MATASAQPSRAVPARGTKLSDVPTPHIRIDAGALRRNVAAMQDAVTAVGAVLRPHFKTHRTTRVAHLQREAGAIGLTVATVAQLRAVVAEVGGPVLVSSLLQADAGAAAALRGAAASGQVTFAVDSARTAELLRAALGPEAVADVMIEVEAGCARTGVPAGECPSVARAAARLGLRVTGLFTYPGQSYAPGVGAAASEEEQAALERGAAELSRAGFDPEHISAGSTPTMPFARPGVATEYRPGTYVFGDRRLVALGATEPAQLALTVVASVVAARDGRVVLDAGGKALGRDALPWLEGYGQLADEEGAIVTRLYDHHSVVEPYHGRPLNVGDRVAVIPNNANSVMVLSRAAWLSGDESWGEELRPHADR